MSECVQLQSAKSLQRALPYVRSISQDRPHEAGGPTKAGTDFR